MTQPKLVVEQVFDRFKEFSRTLLDEVAEPRSLLLVVDWQIGQNDFPPGLLITRSNPASLDVLLETEQQLNKMTTRIMAACITTLKREIKELEQRKAELEGSATTEPSKFNETDK